MLARGIVQISYYQYCSLIAGRAC